MIITDGRLHDMLLKILAALEAVQANPLSDNADRKVQEVREELGRYLAEITPR